MQNQKNIKNNYSIYGYLNQLKSSDKQEQLRLLKKIKSFTFEQLLSQYSVLESFGFYNKAMLFPRAYKDVIGFRDTPLTESLTKEIIWAILPVFKYYDEIKSFLSLRNQFEKDLLKGNIAAAALTHDIIIKQYGYSLWSLNAGFLINSYGKKLEDNRRYLADITKIIGSPNSIEGFCSECISMRMEANVSNNVYNKYIKQTINDIHDGTEISTKLEKLLELILNIANIIDVEIISFWGVVSLPLIDRYLLLMSTLHYMYSSDLYQFEQEIFERIVKKLHNKIYDPQIANVVQILEPKAVSQNSGYQANIMAIIENYTLGRYEQVIADAKIAICDNPECFELYEIYINSFIYTKRELDNPFNANSLANDIMQKVYSIKTRDIKIEEMINGLLKIANNFGPSRLSSMIISFVRQNKYSESRLNYTTHEILNYNVVTPRTSIGFANAHKAITFIDNINKCYSTRATTALYRYVASQRKTKKILELDVELYQTRKEKYKAYGLKCSGNYKDAANHYYLLYLKTKDDILTHVEAIKHLSECLIISENYESWVEVIVDTYLRRPSLLTSVNILQLHKSIENKQNTINVKNICWSIYYSILYKEELLQEDYMHLYELCDDYLLSRGIKKIHEFGSFQGDGAVLRYIYFLRNVYTSKVIDNSIHFRSTEDLENEIISKYQILQQMDPKESEYYSNEIKKITQNAMIRKSILRINQSKIYVDIANIKNTLDVAFPESYKRYLEYLKLTKELRKICAVGNNSIFIVLTSKGEYDKQEVAQEPRDLTFDLFKDLFDEIGNKYAINLDSYLSTRIRHGTLSGQIRSMFEKEKLITLKNKSNIYESNEYWLNRLASNNESHRKEYDECFREFSKSIDNVIEKVKSDWIQIKKPEKPCGLFDYEFSSDEYLQMHTSLSDPNMNIDALFASITNLLNKRTTACLDNIRNIIKKELNAEILHCIEMLSNEVDSDDQLSSISDLRNAIARCRTEVPKCLDIVAGWFDDIGEDKAPDFKLSHLVDTVVEIINNCFPGCNFKPQRNISDRCIFDIKGICFNPMVDIFFIIFENIVKHAIAHINSVMLDVEISEGVLVLVISNKVPEEVNSSLLSKALDEIRNKLKFGNIADVISQEGGSGLYKIYRILQNDLHQDPNANYGFEVIEQDKTYKIWIKLRLQEPVT